MIMLTARAKPILSVEYSGVSTAYRTQEPLHTMSYIRIVALSSPGTLEKVVSFLASQTAKLKPFYRQEAILMHPDDCSILLSILASLEHYQMQVCSRCRQRAVLPQQ